MTAGANDAVRHDARQALEDCLGVRAGDCVTVVFDEPRAWQARAIADVARGLGATPLLVDFGAEVEALLADPLIYAPPPPRPLKDAMVGSEACVWITDMEWPLHLFYAVYDATAEAQRAGTKIAWLERDLGTWDISKQEMETISNRVWTASAVLSGVRELHVTSPAGTDIRVSIDGRRPIHNTPIVRTGEMFAFVPYYGELALAPVETVGDGTIVFDGSMLGTGVGPHSESASIDDRRVRAGVRTTMVEEPVVLRLEGGRCVDISGGPEAEVLKELFAEIPEADRIAEVAFGTSQRSAPTHPGRLGTAHFAFGDNKMYYGSVVSPMHQNGLVRDASIQIVDTGQWLLRDGRWQLPE
jgi:leucyl aminopeptidase (aminopeptidase T)